MKQLFALVELACLIALLLPACAPAPEPAPEPVFVQAVEEAAIREMMEQGYAAVSKHDGQAFMALHAEDYENWDGSIKGLLAREKAILDSWERRKERQVKLLEEIGIVFVSTDVAIYKARDEITGSLDANEKPIAPFKRLAARVFVKRSGEWLWVAEFNRAIEE